MGRQKEFDEQQVLDRAMRIFWSKGYEATSIQDLVVAMGINRASIYGTFGDKEQLYLSSLNHYIETQVGKRRAVLKGDGPARDILVNYLHSLVDFALGEGGYMGCLITNSSVELSPRQGIIAQQLGQAVDGMEDLLEQLVLRAQQEGDIAPDKDPHKIAQFLICHIQGLRVLTRAHPNDTSRLRSSVDVALSVLN